MIILVFSVYKRKRSIRDFSEWSFLMDQKRFC